MPEESSGASTGRAAPGRRRANARAGARTNRVVVKCSDDELARLYAIAAARDLSIPNVLMRAVFAGGSENARVTGELLQELRHARQLSSVATGLLNQVAKVGNSTGELPPETAQVLRMVRDGQAQVDGFLAQFGDRWNGPDA